MKKLLFAFIAFTMLACSSDDSAPANPNNGNPNPENPNPENPNPENPNPVEGCDNVFFGSIILKTQAEVDDFAAHNYCAVAGELYIGDLGDNSDISDLSGLASIREIDQELVICRNPYLVNLHGLENLQKIRQLSIYMNSSLVTTEHLQSLTEIGSFDDPESNINIHFNFSLTDLKGLAKIKEIRFLEIFNCMVLEDLSGLEGLEKVGTLSIISNWALTSLTGLENVTHIDNLKIRSNPLLNSIQSLQGLEKVTVFDCSGNDVLTTLCSNPHLTKIENFYIFGNSALTDLGAFENVVEIKDFRLSDNHMLTTLDGFQGLKSVSALYISNCFAVTSLEELSGITAITEYINPDSDAHPGITIANTAITSLEGLQNINSFNGKLKFRNNQALSNFCAVSNSINAAESIDIQNNAYNPSKEDILAGNCSQP